ncbi:trypsin-like serine peptidase [Microtetraspora malaysiensis]|uniref:trypsin-like serine peptidase n=1 Tax=Microtetraspora malaysiensis TaxID=161358 RepID=UPI003D8B5C1A
MKRVVLAAMRTAAAAGVLCAATLATSGAPAHAYDIAATRPLATEAQVPSVLAYWLSGDGHALTAATPYALRLKVTARQTERGAAADGNPGGVRPADSGSAQEKAGQGKTAAGKTPSANPPDAKPDGGKPANDTTDPDRTAQDGNRTAVSKNVNLPRTTGRVFFVGSDDKPYWCSGTSVQGPHRNLVATAGHCAFDTETDGAPMRKWVFIPGYQPGAAPSGVYVGKQAFTHHDFATYRDLDRDYAFVAVHNGLAPQPSRTQGRVIKLADGGRLGDGVGGQGLAYNQEIGRRTVILGHSTPPVRGATFRLQDPSIRANALLGLNASRTTDGSSWLIGYRKAGRLGYLNGVTIAMSGGAAVSPYFDGELFSVYVAARKVRSGVVPGGVFREGANEINIL